MYIFIIIIYIDDSENGLEFWGAHATRLKESQTAASNTPPPPPLSLGCPSVT